MNLTDGVSVPARRAGVCARTHRRVLIFGPGEAKTELKQRLDKHPGAGRDVAVETSDKLTTRQVVAKVRTHFAQ